ncbi:MAG: GTPase HflX [Methylohalobius sp.]|nr:GTPase HflX [Methylohalobius sp.]
MLLFERPNAGEKVILVHIAASRATTEDMEELAALAASCELKPVAVIQSSRDEPDPKLFIGRGKVAEVRQAVVDYQAELVLFNCALSPSQERNLEQALGVRVMDRTGLILNIFAQRARSYEGKLQVELAQLRHMAARLVRGWTHLERQQGGIGLRGPGETQLEIDRRLIAQRIRQIEQRLRKVEGRWRLSRSARKRAELPTVALVGYTNAGKSTLFNALTQAGVYAADQLFATLDSTLRRLQLDGGSVVLADTVGFIRHLPHELVAAFRSTLQETCEAEVVLHVIDASADQRQANIEAVYGVLEDLGIDRKRVIEVYNKIDRLGRLPQLDRNADGWPARVWLSARTGAGLEFLLTALSEVLAREVVRAQVHLSPSEGALRARLFTVGRVLRDEATSDGGWNMEVELPARHGGFLESIISRAVAVSGTSSGYNNRLLRDELATSRQ